MHELRWIRLFFMSLYVKVNQFPPGQAILASLHKIFFCKKKVLDNPILFCKHHIHLKKSKPVAGRGRKAPDFLEKEKAVGLRGKVARFFYFPNPGAIPGGNFAQPKCRFRQVLGRKHKYVQEIICLGSDIYADCLGCGGPC